jgi:hypothetical protein
MLYFFICCIVAPFIGRKMGWTLSRRVFYSMPSAVAVPLCLLWGVAIALAFRWSITGLHPNLILAILGFAAGAYIAVPDLGIGEVWMAPYGSATRKDIVSNFPFLMYLLSSIAFYFAIK